MIPTFQGGPGAGGPLSAPLVEWEGPTAGVSAGYAMGSPSGANAPALGPGNSDRHDEGLSSWTEDRQGGGPSFPVSVASGTEDTEGSITSVMVRALSFVADARLGAQVARVHLGVDAKVRKACESPLLAQLGLQSSRGAPMVRGESSVDIPEPPGLRPLIQSFQDSQAHLEVVLLALEDYQRHRQGLADSAQRLGIALREAGQRAPGMQGEAFSTCGAAHQQAAACRTEVHATEELRVLSKLRAHHGKAAADCKRAVRKYESALRELRFLQRARSDAFEVKKISGDSPFTPAVESGAQRVEEAGQQRLHEAAEAVKGKLTMFQAKHAVDYAESIAFHMKNVVREERSVADELAGIGGAIEQILSSPHPDFLHE